MKTQEVRALNDEQLREEMEKARREVFNLRFRAVTRQLSNSQEVGRARKNVARLLTVLRERQLAGSAQEG
ncbi:MAG: 50S ribosomal protein L29 [Chloroflexi bacterium]|nr:50S ribosomal protein L29 [Chloroflexota bacterium]